MSGSNTSRTYSDGPVYAVFESGARLENSFLRVSYEATNMEVPTAQIDGFFPVFDEELNEPLSTGAIVGITVAVSFTTIAATVLIVVVVIWRRKKRWREREKARKEARQGRVRPVEQRDESPVRRTLAVARTIEEAEVIEFDTRGEVEDPNGSPAPGDPQSSTSDDSFVSVEVQIDGTRSYFYENDPGNVERGWRT
jgi:hypothetical protein